MNRIPSAMRQSVARSFFAYRHSDWRRASSLVAKMRIVSFVVVGLFATSARAQQTTGAKSASTQPATVKVPSANQEERTESTRAANVTDNMWKVSSSTNLEKPGVHTVSLTSCPPGVFGVDPVFYNKGKNNFYIYISGSGAPEAVLVTGGKCAGDGKAGTLEFTTKYSHPNGYALGSATGGIYEASIAARIDILAAGRPPGTYKEGGLVMVGPGQFVLHAPLNLATPFQTVDFSGSVLTCEFDADCINVTNAAQQMTLINPKGQASVVNGRHAFIVLYGQGTRLFGVQSFYPGAGPPPEYGAFGYGVVNVSDQGMLLDGMNFSQITCTPAFCGSAVYAPGPFSGHSRWSSAGDNAAVGFIRHLNLSLNGANGVDWQSGNIVRISDSIIQGYGQFGVRSGLSGPQGANGGYGMTQIDNLYEEVGNSYNPLGNVGTAGIIVNQGRLAVTGGEAPSGSIPLFAEHGDNEYYYWLLPHNATSGYANIMFIGHAKTDGTAKIPITFYEPEGMTDFSILRTSYKALGTAVPTGTGDYAVVKAAAVDSACVSHVCRVSDSQAPLSNFAVPSSTPGWFPVLSQGVGALILGGAGGKFQQGAAVATLNLNNLNSIGIFQNNVMGITAPAIYSQECLNGAHGGPLWEICTGAGTQQMALLLQWQASSGLKGRLNFLNGGAGPGHIITLVDSDPTGTLSQNGWFRPRAKDTDSYIGCDTSHCNASNSGIALGAPVSISNYIGNVGDGKSWKERLTQNEKTFALPVVIQKGSTLTIGAGSPVSQVTIYRTQQIETSSVPPHSCIDIDAQVSGLTDRDNVMALKPPRALGNLSLEGYPTSSNTIVLHFCNPSTALVNI